MLLNIIYSRINESAMLNKSHITLLLINELLSNRFLITKNEFETYLSGRKSIQIVQKQHIRGFVESYIV